MRTRKQLSRHLNVLRPTALLVVAAIGTASSTPAQAAQPDARPVAVSPGSGTGSLIGDACPTFSWGAVSGAKSYELVVYRVEDSSQEARSVLERSLPGSATTWTPSLESCLARGARYAWNVRAVGQDWRSEWSPLNIFQVASGPSEAEFEAAVEVVRSYLAIGEGAAETSEPVVGETEAPASAGPGPDGPPVPLAPPAATQLSVDGNIAAASFTGDGSNLTGVGNPDGPCFDATRRFADCGNGTVTDTVTGLIYLKDANCFGVQNWVTANQSAAGLADGDCGLTDGSRPGDWRLQAKEEWEGILDSSCTTDPEIVGNQTSGGCYTDAGSAASEWASGVVSSTYWSAATVSGDATFAWFALLNFGVVGSSDKTLSHYVWPVRGGQ